MKKKTVVCKHGRRRILAASLCAVLTLSLAACGKQGTETTKTDAKEFVYVPEYISLGEDETVEGGTVVGDRLYYINYQYDEETGTSTNTLNAYSLTDASTKEIPLALTAGQNLSTFSVDEEGSVVGIINEYPEEPSEDGVWEAKALVVKFDTQGQAVFSKEITDLVKDENGNLGYVRTIQTDGDKNIYICMDSGVVLLDPEGEKQGNIDFNASWIQSMCRGKDNKIYVTYYDNASGGLVLAELNAQEKKVGSTYQNLPNGGNGGIVPAVDKDFLVNDGNRVYEYDMSSQTYEELFSWLDCDINGTYVNYFGVAKDGRMIAIIRDWNTNGTEIAKLSKTNASEVVQKEQIVIGTLYDSQQLQSAAVAFNKASDKYRVSIKTYIDNNNWTENSYNDGITALNNDITSKGSAPDILDLSQVNEKKIAEKGVFEDLTPYLEKSDVLSRDDFKENILEEYMHDGKMYSIPASFSLSSIVGKTSVLGDKMGWTVKDMMALAKEHPDAKLFDGVDKANILYYCMAYNQDFFVDWEKGECNFEVDEFKQILEFVSMFPDEIDWATYDGSGRAERLQSDSVLLENVGVYDFQSTQMYPAMFGEDVTYIGFPTMDGSVGCMLNTDSRYGINAKSGNKDGAWAFIEHYLLSCNADNMFFWGFSTRKAEFQKQIEEATKEEYLLDENGEAMLDENGDPIPAGGVSSMSMDGWEYTYHRPTEEEVATVKELIDTASPASSSDDEIIKMITEEAAPYFQGQKTLDEVVKIIQSRAQIYVSENS